MVRNKKSDFLQSKEEVVPDKGLHGYYAEFNEKDRLFTSLGALERERTRNILARFLPKPPAVILDIGGAAGVHAFWLAEAGYEVHLIDPVPLHIEQAKQEAGRRTGRLPAGMLVGDARKLERPSGSVDAVLLLGPLYHLTSKRDRLQALSESRRVLRRGGRLFAAAISRFASLIDGLFHGFLDDPAFVEIVRRDLVEGQHRNTTGNPLYFTSAYFHTPAELREEIEENRLTVDKVLAVDGLGALLPHFSNHWEDPARRALLLEFLEAVEFEPSLLGATAHLLAVAKKS